MAPSRTRTARVSRLTAPIAFTARALVLGSALLALAGACAEDSTTTAPGSDGGGEGGSVSGDDCPGVAPVNGAACSLPEGTTCDFGACGTRLARCTLGAWRLAANAPPSPPCPIAPPSADIACPACWPAAVSCTYGSTDCSLADASLNTAIASCPSGTWILDIRPCRDGGGPDVQGDGGADAD